MPMQSSIRRAGGRAASRWTLRSAPDRTPHRVDDAAKLDEGPPRSASRPGRSHGDRPIDETLRIRIKASGTGGSDRRDRCRWRARSEGAAAALESCAFMSRRTFNPPLRRGLAGAAVAQLCPARSHRCSESGREFPWPRSRRKGRTDTMLMGPGPPGAACGTNTSKVGRR
jgi:hypothetical protein